MKPVYNTCKKVKFSTLMTNFTFMLLEIMLAMEKIQLC